MKELSKSVAVPVMIFLLFAAGCREPENPGTNPVVPQNPNELTVELTESELLSVFSLTKGSITASAAAKKIANDTPSASSVIFTERNFIAYDDEAGTFTVKVKGTKNGKNFSNTITMEGFTHPYNSVPFSKNLGDKLKFDAALEDNLKLQNFIDVLKNAANIADHLELKFTLKNGKIIDIANSAEPYKFTADFAENSGKIKLTPKYELIYKKLAEGASEKTEKVPVTTVGSAFRNIEYNYFTENDVFDYVAEKVKDEIIKVPANTFASYIYVDSLRVGSFCHGAVFDSQCKNHLWQAMHSEWHSYLQDIRCCIWHNILVSCVVVHVRFFSPYGYKRGKLYR